MLKMFSVFDNAVGSYMQPFFVRSAGEAIRTFADAVNDRSSPFYKHPTDFVLFFVGEFDQNNGEALSIAGTPSKVVTALDVLQDNLDVMPATGRRAAAE